MAPHPTSIGEWLHKTVRLGLIATAVSLLAMALYTAVLTHEAALGILIAGSLVSIVGDVGAILLYSAKSSAMVPTVILADIGSGVFCGIGAVMCLSPGFHSGDDISTLNEATKGEDAAYMTFKLGLAVVGLRVASTIGTGILGCTVVRQWRRQRESESPIPE